jgi:SAF domain
VTAKEDLVSNRDKRVTDAAAAARAAAPGSPAAELAAKPGLRVRPYRPMRALVGAFLVVASVVAALTIYARLDDRVDVLVLTRDVLAGEQITGADLAIESVNADTNLAHTLATDRGLVVDRYARVALAAGDLIHSNDVQERPLTRAGHGLVSVPVAFAHVPPELREQSRVWLVVTPPSRSNEVAAPVLVDAVVVSMPHNPGDVIGESNAAQGMVAITVEVAQEYAAIIGQAAAVSLMVVSPDEAQIPPQIHAGVTPAAVAEPTTTAPTGSPG